MSNHSKYVIFSLISMFLLVITASTAIAAPNYPTITWSNPANMTYGTALSSTQLNAVAKWNGNDVAGTFTYTPAAGTVMAVGMQQTLHVDFKPTDTAKYNSAVGNVRIIVLKATPTITWSNPADITYGSKLSSTQLNAVAKWNGKNVAGTFTYTPPSGTVMPAGTQQSLNVIFKPTAISNYNSATADVKINVLKVTPTITWSNPADITYGTALSSTQLNAVAKWNGNDVAGTFTYTPASGTVMSAGTQQSLNVIFTPSDTVNYNSASGNAKINVLKVTPTITWSDPADITYGTALSSTQLNAVAKWNGNNVAGAFAYNPIAGTVLDEGQQNLKVDFTPTDTSNYNSATANVKIKVLKATPTITWSNPADITYGTALSSVQLNAVASVAGTFAYNPAEGTVLDEGQQDLKVDFKPTDTSNYNSATANVKIEVLKATPTITWNNPADITYGTAFSSTQLNAVAKWNGNNVAGTFTYTPASGTVLNAGTQQNLNVIFTPNDAVNYKSATKEVTINVLNSTPEITWSNPADITYGTALSSTQLNAVASVAGSFAYTPANGTILNAGQHTLNVVFTPTDTVNYKSATANVTINVLNSTPEITWSNPADITYGTKLSSVQLNASASVDGSFAYTPANGTVLSEGQHTLNVVFTPTDAVNYKSATANVKINVTSIQKTTPEITWSNPADITYGTELSSTQLNAVAKWNGNNVDGSFAYTPANGTVLSEGQQTLNVIFTPTDTVNYNSATANVTINVTSIQKTTPEITWSNPADITYGTALSGTQLNASASVAGTFVYTPAEGTVLDEGQQNLKVDFTPTDTAKYTTASANVKINVLKVTLNVLKVTPTITWSNPADITYGTKLSRTQLNAVAKWNGNNVAGSFSYTPTAGTVLSEGQHTLHVDFTPTDTAKYSTVSKDVTINVSPKPVFPVADFSSNVTSGIMPLTVSFTDASIGVPTSWKWNFGDGGDSTDKNPVYTYSKAGTYTVRLTVRNVAGNNVITKQKYIIVKTGVIAPDADFTASLTNGNTPLGVAFTDNSEGTPTSWRWSFGDGNTSTDKNPVNIYSKAGIYTVKLTVRNAAGSSTETKSRYITALAPPVAAFSASTTKGKVPLTVEFTDQSKGSPTSWTWNFGDGNTSTDEDPVNIYSKKGDYTVTLTVNNAAGSNTIKKSKCIHVDYSHEAK